MSNENYYDNDNDELYNELNGSSGSNGKDGMANLRAAKRADEKRIKELEEQLAAFSKERNEQVITRVLESKGVPAKAARLILKDLDAISEESVSNWLNENGDLIGYTPNQEKQIDEENLRALQQQDSVSQSANTPAYSEDVERAILNAKSEEEIMSIIKSLG